MSVNCEELQSKQTTLKLRKKHTKKLNYWTCEYHRLLYTQL